MTFDLTQWIHIAGYTGILLIIFLQTGLLLGFFFPGDSLLFTAGFLASQHYLNIYILTPAVTIIAIVGYAVAYWLGKLIGHWLLQRKDTWYFKKRYLEEAKLFYEKQGAVALIMGRLIPLVRTFVPIVAGMAEMNYVKYTIHNIIGGFLWATGITLLGYFLGEKIPNVQHYILPVVVVVVVVSLLPGVWHVLRKRLN